MWSWGKLAGASWRIRHLAPKHSKLQQMTFNNDDFPPAATTDRHTEHQEPYHPPKHSGPPHPPQQPGSPNPLLQSGPYQPQQRQGPAQPSQQPGSAQPP